MKNLNVRFVLAIALVATVSMSAQAQTFPGRGRGNPGPVGRPAPRGPVGGPVRGFPGPVRGPVIVRGPGPVRGPVIVRPAPVIVRPPVVIRPPVVVRPPVVRPYPTYPYPTYPTYPSYPSYPTYPSYPNGPGYPGYPNGPIVVRGSIYNGSIVFENGRRIYRPYGNVVRRAPVRRVYRDYSYDYDRSILDLINLGQVERLGSTFVANTTDYDTIEVRECGVKQVQIRVRQNDVNLDHIIAVYEDGTSDELDVNEFYEQDSFSRWIDLPGYSRCVREIVVIGDTAESYYGNQQAEVEVYGLK